MKDSIKLKIGSLKDQQNRKAFSRGKKKKREDKITAIRNKSGDIITELSEIKRI